jgi:5-methylcytosine-specific restriction enzyme A
MGRLKSAAPTVATLRPVVGYLSSEARERVRDKVRRNRPDSLRHLYNTKRWRCPKTGMRRLVLDRDEHACQMCGCLLIGSKHAPNSPIVDHKKPHRGNLALFWDIENLQALCKSCHDSTKQAMERKADREGWG